MIFCYMSSFFYHNEPHILTGAFGHVASRTCIHQRGQRARVGRLRRLGEPQLGDNGDPLLAREHRLLLEGRRHYEQRHLPGNRPFLLANFGRFEELEVRTRRLARAVFGTQNKNA